MVVVEDVRISAVGQGRWTGQHGKGVERRGVGAGGCGAWTFSTVFGTWCRLEVVAILLPTILVGNQFDDGMARDIQREIFVDRTVNSKEVAVENLES